MTETSKLSKVSHLKTQYSTYAILQKHYFLIFLSILTKADQIQICRCVVGVMDNSLV